MTTVYILQHAEKQRRPGDPSLSANGREQARSAAAQFAGASIRQVFASNLRRTRETAQLLASELGIGEVTVDRRFGERMNLGVQDDIVDFALAWERSSYDRDYKSPYGDSSRDTGERFRSALEEIARTNQDAAYIVVAHGGCTVDLLRDLVSDTELDTVAPGMILNGVRPCAVTELRREAGSWRITRIAGHACNFR